jgi:hypothetical protein
MFGGSTMWSSTLIRIMSSLFIAVSLSRESIEFRTGGRRAGVGEPSPVALLSNVENYLLAK